MAKLYSNENFPLAVVKELRVLGHDALTSQEAGRAGQGIADSDVVAFASSQDRAVLTHNRRHFIRLHRADAGHAGIIVCTENFNIKQFARHIHNENHHGEFGRWAFLEILDPWDAKKEILAALKRKTV
jgi:hypothetical protein